MRCVSWTTDVPLEKQDDTATEAQLKSFDFLAVQKYHVQAVAGRYVYETITYIALISLQTKLESG